MGTSKDRLDFIVIGAQKSGTTSLFQHLKYHPEIFIPSDKEAPYFSHDQAVFEVEWSSYMNKIARRVPGVDGPVLADPSLRWGTITPQYAIGGVWSRLPGVDPSSYDERTVPARIRERLPDVRLVAVLRDPVERALSHHRMLVRRGEERQTFDELVAQLLTAEGLHDARQRPEERTSYVAWGEYGRILSGYYDVFPREQILILFTEELEQAPDRFLRRVEEFIGVSTDYEPENLGERYNVATAVRGFLWRDPSTWLSPSSPVGPQGMRRSLSRMPPARAVWQRLPRHRQRPLRRSYQRVARRTARWNRRQPANEVRANAAPARATLQRLREHYAEDGKRLSGLLDETPPWLAAASERGLRPAQKALEAAPSPGGPPSPAS
jgi:Sulfotransferase domain